MKKLAYIIISIVTLSISTNCKSQFTYSESIPYLPNLKFVKSFNNGTAIAAGEFGKLYLYNGSAWNDIYKDSFTDMHFVNGYINEVKEGYLIAKSNGNNKNIKNFSCIKIYSFKNNSIKEIFADDSCVGDELNCTFKDKNNGVVIYTSINSKGDNFEKTIIFRNGKMKTIQSTQIKSCNSTLLYPHIKIFQDGTIWRNTYQCLYKLINDSVWINFSSTNQFTNLGEFDEYKGNKYVMDGYRILQYKFNDWLEIGRNPKSNSIQKSKFINDSTFAFISDNGKYWGFCKLNRIIKSWKFDSIFYKSGVFISNLDFDSIQNTCYFVGKKSLIKVYKKLKEIPNLNLYDYNEMKLLSMDYLDKNHYITVGENQIIHFNKERILKRNFQLNKNFISISIKSNLYYFVALNTNVVQLRDSSDKIVTEWIIPNININEIKYDPKNDQLFVACIEGLFTLKAGKTTKLNSNNKVTNLILFNNIIYFKSTDGINVYSHVDNATYNIQLGNFWFYNMESPNFGYTIQCIKQKPTQAKTYDSLNGWYFKNSTNFDLNYCGMYTPIIATNNYGDQSCLGLTNDFINYNRNTKKSHQSSLTENYSTTKTSGDITACKLNDLGDLFFCTSTGLIYKTNINPTSNNNANISLNKEIKNEEIYPNPVADFLYINNLNKSKIEYIVISIDGKVLTNGITSDKIDLTNYNPGLYILKTKQGSYKFIKE